MNPNPAIGSARLSPSDAAGFVLSRVGSEFAQDPYPDLRILRDHAPVCRQPDGSYVITRYDDVRQVLTDVSRFSSDKRVDFKPKFGDSALYEHHTTSLVFNDPPQHTRVRKLLAPFFAAQTLRALQSSITVMVDALLDEAAQKNTVDIMQDFAPAIPLNLIGDLLGVPPSEREPLRGWANLILGGLEPVRSTGQLAEGNQAVDEFKQYLRDLIKWKRAHPADRQPLDILWALIDAHDAGDGLDELEILHNCIFMLNAGHDTTTSLIANGVDALLRFPDQAERLRRNPALLRTGIEEMLRFESPLQIGNRRVIEDVDVGGHRFLAGDFLHVVIASANRDERQFPEPDRFDVGRDPNRHLAFGHGTHFCAGNGVARMEASIAFERLITRFPDLQRAGPTVRPDRSRFRIVEKLPVRLLA